MAEALHRVKRPASPMLSGPYGHPFHPILVTVPIGAWTASLVFDIGSRAVSESGFLARGAAWLIAIGLIGALLAATVGLIDFLTIPRGTAAFRTGLTHLSLNLVVVAAYIANFFWRYADYGDVARVRIGQLVLSAVSLAVLGVSGYLGGKLAYRYGVRVVDQSDQGDGYQSIR